MLSLARYPHPLPEGTFVTADGPTLTRHNPSQFIVYIRARSGCCAFYGFGQMHSDMYPSL